MLVMEFVLTRSDIDRFFETEPGMIVCNNKLATQLSRPQMFADEDERIAQAAEADAIEKQTEKDTGVTIERIA